MSSLTNRAKGFSLPELLVATLISLSSLALLAPSIKSGYQFQFKNFEEHQTQLSNQKLEETIYNFFNNSEQIAGLRQVYTTNSGELAFLLSDSSVVGKLEDTCFQLSKTHSGIRAVLAVTVSGYKLLKLNPNRRTGRKLCQQDLVEEIELLNNQTTSSLEPSLAVIGVRDLVSLSLNSDGELRRISLLSRSNQKIIADLENFIVEEDFKEIITISWRLKGGTQRELKFSVIKKKSSHLEWLNL